MSFVSIKKKYGSLEPAPIFSIIIPTWNNLPHVKLLVKSIRSNSTHPHQIILHINEGKDGTIAWADAQQDVWYTQSDANIGICKAVNVAARLANAEYIMYMNDDMYVCPKWDAVLYKEIQSIGHPYFFLSSTMIEHYDSGNPCVVVANYGTSLDTFQERHLISEYEQHVKEDWSGSTWPPNVVHKDVWDMIGGFSIEYSPGMYSDPDFSRKLWELGVRYFKGMGASKIYHFGSKSTKRIKVNKGRTTFLNKWGITANTFSKYILKTGQAFTGILPEENLGKLQKLISYVKKL